MITLLFIVYQVRKHTEMVNRPSRHKPVGQSLSKSSVLWPGLLEDVGLDWQQTHSPLRVLAQVRFSRKALILCLLMNWTLQKSTLSTLFLISLEYQCAEGLTVSTRVTLKGHDGFGRLATFRLQIFHFHSVKTHVAVNSFMAQPLLHQLL